MSPTYTPLQPILPPAMVKSCILFAQVSKGWARHELLASRSQQGKHRWLVVGVGDMVGSGWLSPVHQGDMGWAALM